MTTPEQPEDDRFDGLPYDDVLMEGEPYNGPSLDEAMDLLRERAAG